MPTDFTVFEVISKRCRCLLKLTDNKSGVSLLNIAAVSRVPYLEGQKKRTPR